MKKNILILTIVFFALVVSLSVMLALSSNPASSPAPAVKSITIQAQAIDKNVTELNSFDAELASYAADDNVSQELDATLDEVGEINGATAGLTNDEKNLNNLDSDLTGLSGDEKTNNEIDQSLQGVSL